MHPVHDVNANKARDGSPSLNVLWRAVSGSGITYTVWYSTSSGTETEPPSEAPTVKGITGISTTLSGLTQGTMYYIWVAAVSSDEQGPYSIRVSQTTYKGIVCTNLGLCNILIPVYLYIIQFQVLPLTLQYHLPLDHVMR